MRMGRFGAALLLGLALGSPGRAQPTPAPPTPSPWVGAWGAPPALPNGPEVTNQTIHQVIRLSLGGRAVRVRFTNELGAAPLVIGAARLARPGPARSRAASTPPPTAS